MINKTIILGPRIRSENIREACDPPKTWQHNIFFWCAPYPLSVHTGNSPWPISERPGLSFWPPIGWPFQPQGTWQGAGWLSQCHLIYPLMMMVPPSIWPFKCQWCLGLKMRRAKHLPAESNACPACSSSVQIKMFFFWLSMAPIHFILEEWLKIQQQQQ